MGFSCYRRRVIERRLNHTRCPWPRQSRPAICFLFQVGVNLHFLIIWVIGGPCSFILCFINKGTYGNLGTGHLPGGRPGAPLAHASLNQLTCCQHLGEGESFFFSRSKARTIVRNWQCTYMGGKGCQFKLCRQPGVLPASCVLFCFGFFFLLFMATPLAYGG